VLARRSRLARQWTVSISFCFCAVFIGVSCAAPLLSRITLSMCAACACMCARADVFASLYPLDARPRLIPVRGIRYVALMNVLGIVFSRDEEYTRRICFSLRVALGHKIPRLGAATATPHAGARVQPVVVVS
jgi:hypothetical protein